MTWNHRVVRVKYVVGGVEEVHYGIHEVYYDSDGNPNACTERPVEPYGETLEELAADVRNISSALEKPVLDYDSFEAGRGG